MSTCRMEDVRHFDINSANRLIPLLSQTFTEVRPWAMRLDQILREMEGQPDRPEPEVTSLRAEREQLVAQLRAKLEDLVQLGVLVKAADGLVDFPALLHGREVYLCWRFGETRVGYWHDVDAGLAGRQPIDDDSAFAPSYLS